MKTRLPAGIPFVEWSSGDASWTAEETQRAARAVGDACRQSGYFLLGNHGVPAELIAAGFDETNRFYSRPPDQKARFTCSAESQFLGYRGLGAEKSRMHSGAEACEQYRIGNYVATSALSGSAALYHEPFGRGMMLFEAMAKLGNRLMSLCAVDLGLGDSFFDRFMQAPMHRLGLNYYKVGAGRAIGNAVNIAMTAHIDHAVFTILTQDKPGLEVLSAEDAWVDVLIPPGALFVFLGDYAQRWTNGAYRAATHRVREVASDRMSLQYKHKPSYATVVSPLSAFVDESRPARYESFDTGRQYEGLLQELLAT